MDKNFIDLIYFEQTPNYMKNEIKKLWNPQVGDLFCTNKDNLHVVLSYTNKFILTWCGDNIRKDNCMPLLNETQLISFIRNKFHAVADVTYVDRDSSTGLFEIGFDLFEINSRDGISTMIVSHTFKVENTLMGYWLLIQKMLEEEDRCQEK